MRVPSRSTLLGSRPPTKRRASNAARDALGSLMLGERSQNARIVVRVSIVVVVAVALDRAGGGDVFTPVPFPVTTECATRRMPFPPAKSPVPL
jgi:hypothetical protein